MTRHRWRKRTDYRSPEEDDFAKGTAQEKVDALVEALKGDGFDFTVGIDPMTPITLADRVVSAGKGIGSKEQHEAD